MNIIKGLATALLLSSSLSVAGCAADASSTGDEPMGVSRQALNGLQIASWGGVGTNNGTTFASGVANTVDLGVDTTAWRCWIAGSAVVLRRG
jgi:hypothetical protein